MLPASASMSPLRRAEITKSTPDVVKPVSPIISACFIGIVSACGYCARIYRAVGTIHTVPSLRNVQSWLQRCRLILREWAVRLLSCHRIAISW